MVAYSFKAQFAGPIVALEKRQTVRGNRVRHARPGEPIQLYVAMRTKHCRKLLDRDPVCRDVRPIQIVVDRSWPFLISSIEIAGVSLRLGEMEAFAHQDGFRGASEGECALDAMGAFWLAEHGEGRFDGVVIRWEPIVG
ncbi:MULTISPECIES: hypothetical protein [unclassified Sphingobium]|uniref:hypothetical protein n=1 Tax=unclassified Sphingobium TaxID=2611147 RepID=UPI0035A736F5